jgi:hypothetical protein
MSPFLNTKMLNVDVLGAASRSDSCCAPTLHHRYVRVQIINDPEVTLAHLAHVAASYGSDTLLGSVALLTRRTSHGFMITCGTQMTWRNGGRLLR